ncbi:MAG: type III polyketide synthase [Prochlorotrichaceae cyanobacterium]|jgi:predicted naringenin-chalcone synthase
MYTVLDTIATANPPFKRSQTELAHFMERIEEVPKSVRDRIATIYGHSGIDYRYSCLEDYGAEAEDFSFYPPNWSLLPEPTTGDRNQKYQTCALELADRVAHQALWQADRLPSQITHLIVVSCTGFFAPGLDIHLVQRLGLPASTDRTLIGFMGCNAAFNALKIAHTICQTHAAANVLLVCVELCSLHFQRADTLEKVIINAIFADGAAAAVLSAQEDPSGQWVYTDSAGLITENSLDAMTWEIGNTGFLMQLSPQVPHLIQDNLPRYLDPFLARHNLTPTALDLWAVHPGGRSILDSVKAKLMLSDAALQDSYDVLRQYGNMSSPTILFILKRWMDATPRTSPKTIVSGTDWGIALGFGPGLSIEGALFQQFPR